MPDIKDFLFEEFLCSDRRAHNQAKARTYRGLDPDDLQAEFDLGALLALSKCDPSQDPLKYLCLQGFNRVRHVVQAHLRSSLYQTCLTCGKFRSYRYASPCTRCHGKIFRNTSKFVSIDTEKSLV